MKNEIHWVFGVISADVEVNRYLMGCVIKHVSMKLIFKGIKFLGTALIADTDVAANAQDKRDVSVFEKLDDIFRTGEPSVKDEKGLLR